MISQSPNKNWLESKMRSDSLNDINNKNMRVQIHQPSIPGKFMTLFVENQTKVGFGVGTSRKVIKPTCKSTQNLVENGLKETDLKETIFIKFLEEKAKKSLKLAQNNQNPIRYIIIPKTHFASQTQINLTQKKSFIPPISTQHKERLNKDFLDSIYYSELTKKLNAETLTAPGSYNVSDELTALKIPNTNFVFKALGRDLEIKKEAYRKIESEVLFSNFMSPLKKSEIIKKYSKENWKNQEDIKVTKNVALNDFKTNQIQKKANKNYLAIYDSEKNKLKNEETDFSKSVFTKKIELKNPNNLNFLEKENKENDKIVPKTKEDLPKIEKKCLRINQIINDVKKRLDKNDLNSGSCERFRMTHMKKNNSIKKQLVFGQIKGKFSIFQKEENRIRKSEMNELRHRIIPTKKQKNSLLNNILVINEKEEFDLSQNNFSLALQSDFEDKSMINGRSPTKNLQKLF